MSSFKNISIFRKIHAHLITKHIKIFGILIFLITGNLFGRVFFVGSNPHMTVFAFPQDIFLTGTDFAYYYITYQKNPWWGDIDEPELKPNNTYIKTGENIEEGSSGSSFEHNSYLHKCKNYVGFGRKISETARTRFDLTYLVHSMRNKATGSFGDGGNTFDYNEHHSIQELFLRSILALKIKGHPVGFMIGIGSDFASDPDLEFEYSQNGTKYNLSRLIWAWTAEHGSDEFGLGRGRYQSDYALGPLFKLDIQSATSFPKLKLGGRFRFRYGILDQYSWNGDGNSPYSELIGSYIADGTKKIRNITTRLYGNYNWIKRKKWKFNTLVLTRYTHVDSIGIIGQNISIEENRKKESRNFVFQINPNFNIYPWKHKMCYIDMALLCNYSHNSYDFLGNYSVGGGTKESYVNTRAYWINDSGDIIYYKTDYSWLDFSYANQNFFEIAFDVNTVFPIFGKKNQNIALGVTLLVWRRFKWFNKYYGRNNITSTDLSFNVENIRKLYETEMWLNTAINIMYRRGKYNFRLDIGQPLIYSLVPRYRLTSADGETVIYEKKQESMWVSQSGVRLGFFVGTSIRNIFRRHFEEKEGL